MRAHERPLGVVERPRLGQDLLGDRELPDVVQPSGEPAALHGASGQPEVLGRQNGQVCDLLGVLLRDAFPEAARERQGAGQPTASGPRSMRAASLLGRSDTRSLPRAWPRRGSCRPCPGVRRASGAVGCEGTPDRDRELDADVPVNDRGLADGDAEALGPPDELVGRATSCRSTANSSPPQRARQSPGSSPALSRCARSTRTASPTAWPYASLICLKWSASRSSRPQAGRRRQRLGGDLCEAAPVEGGRQLVGAGPELGRGAGLLELPVGVLHLAHAPLEVVLEATPLRHVRDDAADLERAIRAPAAGGPVVHPARDPVGADEAVHDLSVLAPAERLVERVVVATVIRVHGRVPVDHVRVGLRAAEQTVSAGALEQLLERAVRQGECEIDVRADDVERPAKRSLASASRAAACSRAVMSEMMPSTSMPPSAFGRGRARSRTCA